MLKLVQKGIALANNGKRSKSDGAMSEALPNQDDEFIELDPDSNGYFVDGAFMGHINQKMLEIVQVEDGEADPSVLGPEYCYDPQSNTVYRK
jgi:hypothetical protein